MLGTSWSGTRRLPLALLTFLLLSCQQSQVVREYFRDPSPHEAYVWGLGQAGLMGTALAEAWVRASEEALRAALPVTPPYVEEGFFAADEPSAFAYRLSVRRGQRLEATVEAQGAEPTRFFIDFFRAGPDSVNLPARVASAGEDELSLSYEPWADGEYVVRIQPELLREGRFRLQIRADGRLAFPVQGSNMNAIQSFFGDPRDGGRRRHHGVDIFAPRGTPALAAAEGRISRVREGGLGGRTVWIRDNQGHSLYYAHLDVQLVSSGQRVVPGDTVGLVGNTGNARGTSPHLHFGIYRRPDGPLDPWYHLWHARREPDEPSADGSLLGQWVRVMEDGTRLRASPSIGGAPVDTLAVSTTVKAVAVAGEWYRVRLPDGRGGFVLARLTESLTSPLRTQVLAANTVLKATPTPDAPVLQELTTGSDVEVLGAFAPYLYVQPPQGRRGWVAADGAG